MSEFVKTIGEINKSASDKEVEKSNEQDKTNSERNSELKEGGDPLAGVHIRLNDSEPDEEKQ